MNHKNFYEEVTQDEAVNAIFRRVEKEEQCKIARIARSMTVEREFFFTLVLENFKIVEVQLTPCNVFARMGLEVAIEVY